MNQVLFDYMVWMCALCGWDCDFYFFNYANKQITLVSLNGSSKGLGSRHIWKNKPKPKCNTNYNDGKLTVTCCESVVWLPHFCIPQIQEGILGSHQSGNKSTRRSTGHSSISRCSIGRTQTPWNPQWFPIPLPSKVTCFWWKITITKMDSYY